MLPFFLSVKCVLLSLAVTSSFALPACCSRRKASKKDQVTRRSAANGDNRHDKTRNGAASTTSAGTALSPGGNNNRVDKKRARTPLDNNVEDFASPERGLPSSFSPMPTDVITEKTEDRGSKAKKCDDLTGDKKNALAKANDFKVPAKKDEKAETKNPQYQTLAGLANEDVFGESKNKGAQKPVIKAPKKVEPVDPAKKQYETLAGLMDDDQFEQKDAGLKKMQIKAPSKVVPKDSKDPKYATLTGLVDDEIFAKNTDEELLKEKGSAKVTFFTFQMDVLESVEDFTQTSDDFMEEEFPIQQNPPMRPSLNPMYANQKRCKCPKSKCLKLYCECYAASQMCSEFCSCLGCHNNAAYSKEREKSIQDHLSKNPDAFLPKIGVLFARTAGGTQVGTKERLHLKGCHCSRSSCLMNYCECYAAKVPCSYRCRCKLCLNVDGHHFTTLSLKESISIDSDEDVDSTDIQGAVRVDIKSQPWHYVTNEFINRATVSMYAAAKEAEYTGLSQEQVEKRVFDQFGDYINELINTASAYSKQNLYEEHSKPFRVNSESKIAQKLDTNGSTKGTFKGRPKNLYMLMKNEEKERGLKLESDSGRIFVPEHEMDSSDQCIPNKRYRRVPVEKLAENMAQMDYNTGIVTPKQLKPIKNSQNMQPILIDNQHD
ncbi:tesmin/TSO1-like CXC domain, cysteine-rich domain-containing protein [Ditylenchus destructor]|uniref:Tesmin/TSO1-like CXC domain, cysteine-rich domain-containing protein n=1 Tax=Ditylenchus destructor TaxID=166010 RepID=A0AAD4NCM3_9BILA|nr:tesmin/TSO1-like CXC domain, cysteine-rich domain-containing protein [Ditylenchus destructor]